MTLLRLITWPYVRRHVLRSLLTVAGIVLGVAVFVAVHSSNQSVLLVFRKTVDRVAGATQLQVTAGEAGFDEEILEKVQSVPEVRVAVPVIEAEVDTGLPGQGSLLVLGVDLTGDRGLRDYDLEEGDEAIIEDPLVFLAQPDSLMVSRDFAARNGLAINSRLPLKTMVGEKQFIIRGIMRTGGLASAFGGHLAVMDIYAAQKVFGRGRMIDRIDLGVKEGVSLEQCQAALRRLLGPGFEVAPPSARGQQFESMVRAGLVLSNLTSLFALLMGMFIIYNSFAIAVTQRRSEVGILRALGATRGQIQWLFLGESAVAGLVGSGVGLLAGILMARALAGYVTKLLGEAFGVAELAEEFTSDPRVMILALVIGIASSMFAAWLPARNAARVDPVQALQKGKYQVLSAGENRARRILAGVLAVMSALCLLFGNLAWIFYSGYLLAVLAALLLTPTLALWLARTLRPAMKWLRPVEGALAADSLLQAPRRTSATVAALMLSLALVVGFAGYRRSSYDAYMDWFEDVLNPDLFVSASKGIASRSFRFPASLAPELERIPGIQEIQMVRGTPILYRQGQVMLVATETAKVARRVRPRVVAGDSKEMYRLVAEGKGVIISDNLALLQSLRLGEEVEIPTPSGILRLPIVGVILDYSDPRGTLMMDRAVYARHWKDDSVSIFRVYLEPGARHGGAAEVKQRILERLSGQSRLFVLTNVELRQYVLRVLNRAFSIFYVQIFLAVLVAVLGIVNTMTVSIADRKRELGMLQAVGGLRQQVRHTIWMEAAAIGLIGLILGLALGAVTLYYYLEWIRRDLVGLRLSYEFPYTVSLLLLPTILGTAVASSLWPAESAVRAPLVEALEYE